MLICKLDLVARLRADGRPTGNRSKRLLGRSLDVVREADLWPELKALKDTEIHACGRTYHGQLFAWTEF
jgi:hypothetical protein